MTFLALWPYARINFHSKLLSEKITRIQKELMYHYCSHYNGAFPLFTQPDVPYGESHFRWKEEEEESERKQRGSLNGPAIPLVPSAAV